MELYQQNLEWNCSESETIFRENEFEMWKGKRIEQE